MAEYLVRADLDFSWSYHERNGRSTLKTPYNLPVSIGPFKVDNSPNKGVFLAELDLIDWSQLSRRQPNRQYPMSILYLELKVQDSSPAQALHQADSRLEHIECLFRLFQTGDVSIRRHGPVLRADEQRPSLESLLNSRPVKPRMEPLYARSPYPLDDAVLANFVQFFSRYWCTLSASKPNIKIGLSRFNSSYEQRDLPNRLIDLVIALEALFGGGKPRSISYTVAERCAGWLCSPGRSRDTLFSKVKKYYSLRSKVVHGRNLSCLPGDEVDALEGIVRESLRKFLDHQRLRGHTPQGKEIDNTISLGNP